MAFAPPDRRIAAGLWLAFTGAYLLLGGGRFFSVDEVGMFQLTRYWLTGIPVAASHVTVTGSGGHAWPMHGPVLPVLSIPLHLVGDALTRLLPPAWAAAITGGQVADARGVVWGGTLPIAAVSTFNAFATAGLLALLYGFGRQLGFTRTTVVATVVLFGTASLLASHSKNYFTHSLEAFWLVAALLSVRLAVSKPWALWLVGSCCGAMLLTRVSSVIAVPWILLYAQMGARRGFAGLPALLVPIGLAGSGVLAYNAYRFGSPWNSGYLAIGHFSGHLLRGLIGHLFSVGRSLFLYSPPVVLGVVGLRDLARSHRWLVVCILGIGLSLLALYAPWYDWGGGWAWGNRFLLPLVPLMALPCMAWLDRASRTPRWTAVFVAGICGVCIQLLGLAVNVAFVYHRAGFASAAGDAHLFDLRHNPITAHIEALLAGDAIDFWFYRVWTQVGIGPALALALPGILMLAIGTRLMLRR